MRKILILATAVIGLSLSSCSKAPEDVLPKKDGKWNFTGNYTETEDGVIDESANFTGMITFNDDNTYTSTYTADTVYTDNGKWTANNNAVTLTTFLDYGAITFLITDLEKKSETWTYTLNDGNNMESITLKLTK